MATSSLAKGAAGQHAGSQIRGQLIGGVGFDRLMALLGTVFMGGTYLDGWAHQHGFVDKTFFTPWHGVLYGAYFVNALILVAVLWINHRRGRSWLTALPTGYGLSLLGVPLFIAAGVGDMIWHTLFGFEKGIDPLLSPSHLMLALGAMLMVSGPLRAVWNRSDSQHGWSALLPAVLSLTTILSIFTFFTSFAHIFVQTRLVTQFPYSGVNGAWGAASILLQTGILMGIILFGIRRWQLPMGSLTLMFMLNAVQLVVFNDTYELLPSALLAGIISDVLLWRLRPSLEKLDVLRLFAFAVPVVYHLCFFIPIIIVLGGSLPWSIHLWMGVTVMSGVVGLLLSFLVAPPAIPAAK
jgi:hypothetical protein